MQIKNFIRTIDANRTLKDDFIKKAKETKPRSSISVTDLLNLRETYYKRKFPLPPSLEKLQHMMTGTGFHDEFEMAISREEFREQSIEREGIKGKVDIYEHIPIELKTTSSFGKIEERAYYLEQIAMYCAMVEKEKGQLIVYQKDKKNLRVFDVEIKNFDKIFGEMLNRKNLLEKALTEDNPNILPKCSWHNKNCQYQKENICNCNNAEKNWEYSLLNFIEKIEENEKLAKEYEKKLIKEIKKILKITPYSLTFPRKAYFNFVNEKQEKADEKLGDFANKGLLKKLNEIIFESSTQIQFLGQNITIYSEFPIILRTPSSQFITKRENLLEQYPHYFYRLALECSFCGKIKGRIVLFYKKIKSEVEGANFMVYDVYFKNLDELKNYSENFNSVFENAINKKDFSLLPKCYGCDGWLGKLCEYKEECG